MNGTAFNNIDVQSAEDILMQYGFDPQGYQTMISGKTGREIKAKIFMGPVHAETLRHQAHEKYQATGNAPRNPITNEPVGGKAKGGSGKLGEMEQAGLAGHGASALIRERLCLTNPDILVLCKSCGQSVITRVESTDTQAPDVSFTCKNCNIRGPQNMERCTIKKTLRVLWTDLSIMNIKVTYNTSGKRNRK